MPALLCVCVCVGVGGGGDAWVRVYLDAALERASHTSPNPHIQEHHALQERVAQQQATVEELTTELGDAEGKVAMLEHDKETLAQEVGRLQNAHAQSSQEESERVVELEQRVRRLTSTEAALLDAQTEAGDAALLLEAAAAEQARLQERIRTLSEALDGVRGDVIVTLLSGGLVWSGLVWSGLVWFRLVGPTLLQWNFRCRLLGYRWLPRFAFGFAFAFSFVCACVCLRCKARLLSRSGIGTRSSLRQPAVTRLRCRARWRC